MLLSAQKCICIRKTLMPRLHAERRRTRAIDRSGIAERRQKICHVRIVGISHVPLRYRCPDLFKIHRVQCLTHQFPATAGDQHLILIAAIILCQFSAARLRRVADPDSAVGITIRSEIQGMSHFPEFFLCVQKCGVIRLSRTPEGWRHKTDRSMFG